MKTDERPFASRDEWRLREMLIRNPSVCMEDEHGTPAEPWQQQLCRGLRWLHESRRWSPMPVEKEGLWGVWDQYHRKLLVPTEYDEIGAIPQLRLMERGFNDPIPVRRNGCWGLVAPDGSNRIVLPMEYESIEYTDTPFLKVRSHGKYGLVDVSVDYGFTESFPCSADDIWYDETLCRFVYSREGKLGLAFVTEAEFDSFQLLEDESVMAVRAGEKGFLTMEGSFQAMGSETLPASCDRLHRYQFAT